MKSTFKLENLPPISGAASQYSFTVYFQIQEQLGNANNATEWGWKSSANSLQQIFKCDALIPQDQIRKITCKYAIGCKAACGCRKHRLRCSDLCSCSEGSTCINVEIIKIICQDKDTDCLSNVENFNETNAIFEETLESNKNLNVEIVPHKRQK